MKPITIQIKVAALSGLALLAMGATASVEAGIQCKNGQQYNSAVGGWIPSSFCGDELIAQVARSQGMKVSGRELRRNPQLKADACRFVGGNTRVSHLCIGDRPEDHGDSSRN